MTIVSWEKIHEQKIYDGYRKIYRKLFRLPDGQEVAYDIVGGGQIVCTLALTPNQEVILVKQFRVGPEKVFMDLPGGGIDGDEAPEAAAARELLEETGYAGQVTNVITTPVDAYSASVRHHFVAVDCKKLQEPRADLDNTQAETVLMPLKQFRTHLQAGQLVDITTGYLGLDFLHLL